MFWDFFVFFGFFLLAVFFGVPSLVLVDYQMMLASLCFASMAAMSLTSFFKKAISEP